MGTEENPPSAPTESLSQRDYEVINVDLTVARTQAVPYSIFAHKVTVALLTGGVSVQIAFGQTRPSDIKFVAVDQGAKFTIEPDTTRPKVASKIWVKNVEAGAVGSSMQIIASAHGFLYDPPPKTAASVDSVGNIVSIGGRSPVELFDNAGERQPIYDGRGIPAESFLPALNRDGWNFQSVNLAGNLTAFSQGGGGFWWGRYIFDYNGDKIQIQNVDYFQVEDLRVFGRDLEGVAFFAVEEASSDANPPEPDPSDQHWQALTETVHQAGGGAGTSPIMSDVGRLAIVPQFITIPEAFTTTNNYNIILYVTSDKNNGNNPLYVSYKATLHRVTAFELVELPVTPQPDDSEG